MDKKKLWIYDLRTNQHFTLKTKTLKREDLDEFVKLYNPANRNKRKATWSAENPEGCWRCYDYEELIARDKASLDIFWLRDETLADSDNLPPPEVIAQEIVDDLEAALEQFRLIAGDLNGEALGHPRTSEISECGGTELHPCRFRKRATAGSRSAAR